MRKFLLILLILPTFAIGADKLVPLSEPIERITSNPSKIEIGEIAYVAIRCAALYNSVAGYLEQGSGDEKVKNLAKLMRASSEICVTVGVDASLRSQKSAANTEAQLKLLMKIYYADMVENKQLNNNGVSEFIQSELRAASSIYPLFEAMAPDIKARLAGQKPK